MASFLSNLASMVYCSSNKDNPVNEPKAARASAEMREDAEGFVHIETEESDICTLTIPRNILTAEDRKVLSSDLWECEQLDDKTNFRIHYPFLKAAVMDLYNRIEVLHKQKTMKDDTCKSLESVEYRALRHLMGEDFGSQDFDVELETNKNTLKEIVDSNNSPRMMAVKNRLDSLRREDIPLTSDELKKIWDSLDAKPLGSDVYIEPLPDKSGVTVFSLDYNAMTRTKNLINFTIGKVKVTSRSKRNFHSIREEMNEAVDHQLLNLNATSTSDTQTTTDFTAKSGIKVSVYKADITRLAVDAIVNAANADLYHGGGVAAAIARAAGSRLEIEGDEYVKQYGPLKVTDIVPTCAGNLLCKTVLHAVGPRWSEYQDKTRCQKDLVQTVFNSLLEAHKLKFSSLAISSISSAVFGVPTDICASMYLQAVLDFDQQYGRNTSLQHIHFVDVNDYMVKKIQETFVQSFGNDSNKVPTMIATK